jgi:hypothetical protein
VLSECHGPRLWVPQQTPELAFSRNAHQNFFCVLASDDVGEVAEVGGADFPDVEEGIDAECREPFQKHGLRHILPDQRRHLAQKLDKRKMIFESNLAKLMSFAKNSYELHKIFSRTLQELLTNFANFFMNFAKFSYKLCKKFL